MLNLRCPWCLGACGLGLLLVLALVMAAAPQDSVDRDKYAREYVQFLTLQLDQWTKDFPHDYNLALMKPPVEVAKMSEAAKAGATELREAIAQLHALSSAPDVMKSSGFRSQMEKSLAVAKHVNEAMGSQRFPAVLQSDWDQIRSSLNNLARIYQLEQLAILEAPGGGGRGGRGGRGPAPVTTTNAAPPPPGAGLVGYLVDKQCAIRGKGMWVNTECIKRCLRDGDSVVLVTEEGKIFAIANPDKLDPDTYGQKVTLLGKTAGETFTVN
jgi:hypothetical protein